MKTFELNGNVYQAKEFDVNLICDMDENGVSLIGGEKPKMLPTLRAYIACCMETDVDVAGKELQEHLIKGGSIDSISDAMSDAMENSDFFRALEENKNEDVSPRKNSKNTKKNESNTEA